MRSRTLSIGAVVAIGVTTLVTGRVASAHPVEINSITGAVPAAFSSSGDYATDVLGNPWDFNDNDVPPYLIVGTENSFGINISGGTLQLDAKNGSTVKLIRDWGTVLSWGTEGLHKPVDASTYSVVTASVNVASTRDIGVRYVTESGASNVNYQFSVPAGWHLINIDLTQPGIFGPSSWGGKVIRVELAVGGSHNGADREPIQVDWVSLHRPDVHPTSEASLGPTVKLLTPSEEGGADYATDNGNPWDFTGPDDVFATGDLTITSWANGNMNGYTRGNDPFVQLPLPTPLNTSHYHRATIDACYGGGFSLAGAPGGGMVGRLAWFDNGAGVWSETQDIVVLPGCNRMTVDLATNPPVAVNDESTLHKAGWKGVSVGDFRFDLNEDPGIRDFSLNEIKLADDAAFSSTYPITFWSSVSGTADIYATTNPGVWDGTKIGSIGVNGNSNNTFTWNGGSLPNATYWIYVVVKGGGGTAASYATGPLRLERPQPPTPSYYVPLSPARLLDTRDGTGGSLSALASLTYTELQVAGRGGVPASGATAVVLNVTVDSPATNGFITVWPSGEGQPTVSNLNFVPGQTVPNLVTVKIGANGKVNLFNSEGYTHLIADVVGYYTASAPAGGGRFTAVPPGRVLDTRLDGAGLPVGPGDTINVKVTGLKGVPASGVSGVALNVTVDQPTSAGFLTVWPTGETRPLASSHNFVPGLTVANLVLAKVGSNGMVSIFNSGGNTHVVADVIGYFSSSGGLVVPVSPARIADSRLGIGHGVVPLGQQQGIDVDVGGVGPVPANASAVIVNVTSVNSSLPSFITVWPAGGDRPTASTVNPRPGLPVPNLAYLKLGSGGKLSVYNAIGATDFLIDVFGYVV